MPERREPLPWTRFSYDDFLDDPAVVRMGDALIGSYLHLLRAAWKAELHGWPPGHLPNDPTYLAHASRMLDAWPEHASSIGRAFEVTEKWWIQRRIVREYDSARREGRENSRRASDAAKARWMRSACPEHAPSMPGAMQEVRGREVRDKRENLESEPKTVTRAAPAFVRPSLAEVSAYCAEREAAGHRHVDPQAWFDHYASNGWRVGRNPMRDWKAAVRTWERSGFENGNGQPTGDAAVSAWLKRQEAGRA